MSNPFRYFNSSPEVIRLVVMMYVRYPLSPRNVEDLLAERGIDISHETVRFWWNRFGPMFAAEIRKRRVAHTRGYPQWRWHLDEVFVKVNGKLCYLWRAVDHEGEILQAGVTARRAAALKLSMDHEEVRPAAEDRHRRALLLFRSDERAGQRRSARGRGPPQQLGGEFAPAVSTTRTSDAAVSKYEDAAEVQLSSRPGPQPFQSGAPSRRHCQSKFYTACSHTRARCSSTVFAHELPPRSAGFDAENRLYLFALTMPVAARNGADRCIGVAVGTERVADLSGLLAAGGLGDSVDRVIFKLLRAGDDGAVEVDRLLGLVGDLHDVVHGIVGVVQV